MAGINQDLVYAVAQIKTVFVDDVGNVAAGTGTGFFLRTHSSKVVFVTNRHNLDPQLNPKALTFSASRTLHQVELMLRHHDPTTRAPRSETCFVRVKISDNSIRHALAADVSVITEPVFEDKPSDYGFNTINVRELATDSELKDHASMADPVTFIGFPGSQGGEPWWDTERNLPIGRLAGIASRPDVPFSNPQIRTADVTLVSGLSFRGSSGSPVLLHHKPAPPIGAPGTGSLPIVLGIMSGHWWDESIEPSIFRHSGLSYFTRGTSIHALVADL